MSPTNDLIHEKSPYLLQHAHNPVKWMRWSEKAFEKARREDKIIFLSIGYSTCHWCHVMEQESFENEAIAEVLNTYFVSIKVDREERPDVDHYYMQAVQAMTGQGGWPLSVFLTPDLKPFYGGTYFPPEDKWGHPGFLRVLKVLADKWQTDRAQLIQSAGEVAQALKQSAEREMERHTLNPEIFKKAFHQFALQFEARFGGFDQAPKFPRAHALSFLMRQKEEPNALMMVEKTLSQMARGGIYDHLGGGIHRYSTDISWFLPHFEKMLYDQAIAARAYLEAYQMTHNEHYADTARNIFRYVLRELTYTDGAFYSAEDADSKDQETGKKTEGAFYVWKTEEIETVLGRQEAEIFNFVFGAQVQGNVESDPHNEFKSKNVLYVAQNIQEAALRFSKSEDEIRALLLEAKEKLFQVQHKRVRPHLDNKILTDWNGLMIGSLAFGARILNDKEYQESATRAADFILKRLMRSDGRLMHRFCSGEVAIEAFLSDYAFLIVGLCDLYETTFEARFLVEAQRLTKEMLRLFWDEKQGGFNANGKDVESVLVSAKDLYDGAIPSGNSMALLALVCVAHLTQDSTLEQKAQELSEVFSSMILQYPSAYPQFLIALDRMLNPASQIVIAGKKEDPKVQEILKTISSHFLPHVSILFQDPALEKIIPSMADKCEKNGKVTVYFCRNFTCQAPIHEASELQVLLEKENA